MTAGLHLGRLLGQRSMQLPFAECFRTIQGEGPATGRQAVFVRLGLCNLACRWCDSAFTWDASRFDLAEEIPDTQVAAIVEQATSFGVPLFVLTGGEPLMHQRKPAMDALLAGLTAAGEVHVETNGTIPPSGSVVELVAHFTVSPKLANNGADTAKRRIRPKALARFAEIAATGRACFKFVATTREDLDEIAAVVDEHQVPAGAVWVMPEGVTPEQVLTTHRALVDGVIARGWNTTSRLHTLLWGEERGR
ncbi:7-carboxy-7-deazaguanine synthase QueE [Amycolatopsis thermophila]|uniref:7-carboxy-7-deazaguanine synthase n=1 Tax=Amycolatopsis thermophila TaxID=206084 RepID=A0ABU0EN85_9PSEU|nr:7-carboxy-7-deazaguanine synthase QueE [Amycolatopsis thermophila]MDQ0376508.1 organic radical activating enzyme [Amycolatopsis thermophila]